MAAAAGVPVAVDSAGTGDWQLGKPPYGPAIEAAAARGYDISGLRARLVRPVDFEDFDLLVAMDDSNRATLERLRTAGNATPVRLFLDWAPEAGAREVPDPYFTGDFDTALDLIEAASAGLLRDLQTR